MRTSSHLRRLLPYTLLVGALVMDIASPAIAQTTNPDTRFELRPHCIDGDVENIFGGPDPDIDFMTKPTKGTCHEFEILDPETRQTTILTQGDLLDMDVVVRNPRGKNIHRVRAWLAYDPEILEGDSIEIDPGFPQPVPDEQLFSPREGYIKIGASTGEPSNASTVVVARIRMHVTSVAQAQTIISFFNASAGTETETVVVTQDAALQEQGLLNPPLGALLVRLKSPEAPGPEPLPVASSSAGASSVAPMPAPIASSSAQATSSAMSSAPASAHSSDARTNSVFTILQVLHLRATTEGTSVYLAWDALKSADLIGYNMYYGTISGEYIQKRSVDASSTTLTIRNLIPGTRYYFAVRGVNKDGQETDFSQEVAITIGKPETSTSPLFASAMNQGPQGKTPKTDGTVAGNTGLPSTLILFFIVSATIGTVLALRRQFIAFHR